MTARPAPQPSKALALFLLSGWVVAVAPRLGEARGSVELPILLGALAAAWFSCRLPPFQRLALSGLLWAWSLICLGGTVLASVVAAQIAATAVGHGGLDALGPGLLAVLLAVAALVLHLARRRILRRTGRSSTAAPAQLFPWHAQAFLLLSAVACNPGWLPLVPGRSPAGEEAAAGLAVLALVVVWAAWRQPVPAPPAGPWRGQVAVAGMLAAWTMDLAWLVLQQRLPARVFDPAVFGPGLLPLVVGAELLIWASRRRRPPLPGAQPGPGSRLPTWLAAAALLLALAAQRPGLALGAGVLAAWLALPRTGPGHIKPPRSQPSDLGLG